MEKGNTAEEVQLSEFLRAVLKSDPDANAVEYRQAWYTWGQIARSICDLDDKLKELGFRSGSRVGVLLRNHPAQMAAMLTVLVEEYSLVTLNPFYPDGVLGKDIESLDLPVIVGEAADLDRATVIAAAEKSDCAVVELGAELGVPSVVRRTGCGAVGPVSDAAIEMLTSGTTGKPKRVPLHRDRFRKALRPALEQEAGEEGQVVPRLRDGARIVTAPLTHIGGIWGVMRPMLGGRKLVLLEKFVLNEWREAIRRHRPRAVGAAPAGLKMILDADVRPEELESLKMISAGSAPTDPDIVDAFWERYKLPVLTNYGATEFGGPVAHWSLADFHEYHASKRGSVGKLYPSVEARVVNPESGEVLPACEVGVLELKGDQFPDPQNWLRTTDLARLDEDRFLWICGRSDAAINRGGFKVHPEEVIKVLEKHPTIREAVVVGIPDPKLGEIPAAAIILKTGESLDMGQLRPYLREHLLPYQIPAVIKCVADLPRTGSLKPALGEVRKLLASMKR